MKHHMGKNCIKNIALYFGRRCGMEDFEIKIVNAVFNSYFYIWAFKMFLNVSSWNYIKTTLILQYCSRKIREIFLPYNSSVIRTVVKMKWTFWEAKPCEQIHRFSKVFNFSAALPKKNMDCSLNICRACLTEQGDFQSVFVSEESSGLNIHLAEMLMACASIQVEIFELN